MVADPPKVYTFGIIVLDTIATSVKCIHSATELIIIIITIVLVVITVRINIVGIILRIIIRPRRVRAAIHSGPSTEGSFPKLRAQILTKFM